jgi:2-C-methyl-D-erythritol 4-phosphate cytidylyltransferase
MRKTCAVIVAAGKGVRMGGEVPKQFLPLAGKPVLHYSIASFLAAFAGISIIIVHAAADAGRLAEVLSAFPERPIRTVQGGDTRFQSVKNGLGAVEQPSVVFVHDGARPLVSPELIRTCHEAALKQGSAVPCLPLHESIRRVSGAGNAAADRSAFCSIQTPQTFLSEILLPAFDRPFEASFTDEATVVEAAGHRIHLVAGDAENIKVTRPADLWYAEACLLHREGISRRNTTAS